MTLGEALKCVSYEARLQIMEKDNLGYRFIFPKCDLITRGAIEKFYPELLDRELTNGIHGEGIRDGIYIHI